MTLCRLLCWEMRGGNTNGTAVRSRPYQQWPKLCNPLYSKMFFNPINEWLYTWEATEAPGEDPRMLGCNTLSVHTCGTTFCWWACVWLLDTLGKGDSRYLYNPLTLATSTGMRYHCPADLNFTPGLWPGYHLIPNCIPSVWGSSVIPAHTRGFYPGTSVFLQCV